MDKAIEKKKEFDLIEKEKNIVLPDWYKGYFFN